MVEGIYGTIVFGRALGRIATFNEISKKYSGRYGAHMAHLSKPLLEWAGSDLIEVEFSFSLNASWCGDPNIILAQWHFYHENAIAAPLVVGTKPMGPGLSLFVVSDLDETHKHWLTGGRLIAVELRVSFKEYMPFASPSDVLAAVGAPGFGG